MSELLSWYMCHGIVIIRIYQVVEYGAQATFALFADYVTAARHRGNVD